MSIKLIAVDMDGTFLSDQKTYNRERFMAQYQQMKAQGIRFVVASGNQYYQLISFFPEIDPDIIRCVNLSPQHAGAGDTRIPGNHRSAERNSILVVNPAISFLC